MGDMFEKHAKEVFKKAGVSLRTIKAKELFENVKTILQEKMSMLSSTAGLSYVRVDMYELQKEKLVTDLRRLIEEHPSELKKTKLNKKEVI